MAYLNPDKAVVVYSGGLDSTTLLFYVTANHRREDVVAVSFDYGQKHGARELNAAKNITSLFKIEHHVIDLTSLKPLLASSLTSPDVEVPHGHYAADNMKSTVVPMRNSIMLAMASGVAISRNAKYVYAGMHAGDHPVYPDCRPAFVETFNRMAVVGSDTDIVVRAPFLHLSKANIVTTGKELGVPFEKTWSCYEGNAIHCGQCGTCVERQEAFALAGVNDETEYKHYA